MIGKLGEGSSLVAGDAPEEVRRRLAMDEVRRSLAAPDGGSDAKLKKATEGFEAIFIGKLWEQMRKSVPQGGMLHSREEDTYRSMFEREMSVKMAASGGIGLGKMLYEQLREQLVDSASGTRSRTLDAPALASLSQRGEGIPLDADKPDIKSLADAHRAKSLKEAGMVLRRTSARSLGPAETADAVPERLEPDFNPLADTDPSVGAAASAPPEIMNRALNLAAKIEMTRTRAQAAAAVSGGAAQASMPEGLHWPVDGKVSSEFGWSKDAETGERRWKPGVEIAAASGAPVKAGWDGTVVFAGEREGTGNTVVVEHPDGWRSIYGHAGDVRVRAGDAVDAGSILAELKQTGTKSPATLYFEIRKGEQAWNPEKIRESLRDVASR